MRNCSQSVVLPVEGSSVLSVVYVEEEEVDVTRRANDGGRFDSSVQKVEQPNEEFS